MLLIVRKLVKVEDRTKEDDDGEQDYERSDYLIYNNNPLDIEECPHFVDNPRQSIPPQQCPKWNAEETEHHLEWVVGDNKRKLGEQRHEEEYDERIGKSDEECRQTVVEERTLLVSASVHVLCGIRPEAEEPEEEQNDASQNLKEELCMRVVDHVDHDRHSQTGNHCVEYIAHGGADAGYKAIPASFVQRALNTQNTHRPHRRTSDDSYENALEYKVDDIDMKDEWHFGCKVTNKRAKSQILFEFFRVRVISMKSKLRINERKAQ